MFPLKQRQTQVVKKCNMMLRSAVEKICLCFVLLVLSASCLVACQRSPKEFQEISDPTSPLLNLMMTRADFSSDWQWANSGTLQEDIIPTVENDELVERVSRVLEGGFGDGSSYIVINHVLERYTTSPSVPHGLNVKTDMRLPGGEAFIPKLASVGVEEVAQCVIDPGISEQDHRVACKVIVRYGNLGSTLSFSAIGQMDRETIELILNEVLVKIDSRIQDSE